MAAIAFAPEPASADEEPPFSVSLYVKSDTTVPCDTEHGFGDCRIGIYGESVTPGTTLTFTAWETSAKTTLIDTIEETVMSGASYSVGGGGYDPGNWVEVTDGTVTKSVEIPIHRAVIDARDNTVSGHGEPAFAMAVSVYPEDGTQQCGAFVSPDGNGDWSTDFDDPEESGDPHAPVCANTWDFGPGDWVIVASDGIIGFGDIKTVDVVPLFTDAEGTNFEADIIWLANEGITKGCNPPYNDMFCPDDYVTRGQMAAFLVRALGYTDDGGGDLFTDDDGSIFEEDID